jgi:hypothetical protein
MAYEVEFTDEFQAWWNGLTAEEQESIDFSVRLLEEKGPALGRPHVGTLKASRFPNMKELRSSTTDAPIASSLSSIHGG